MKGKLAAHMTDLTQLLAELVHINSTHPELVAGGPTSATICTTAAGDLLLAFMGSDGPVGASQAVTVTGGGLTWSLVECENGQNGDAEVWSAHASGQLSRAQRRAARQSAPRC
jgi:hypothetical protein